MEHAALAVSFRPRLRRPHRPAVHPDPTLTAWCVRHARLARPAAAAQIIRSSATRRSTMEHAALAALAAAALAAAANAQAASTLSAH